MFFGAFVWQKPSSFSNLCNGGTTFAKLGIKSILLCIMQMKDFSSSLSFNGLFYLRIWLFTSSEVNKIPQNFISDLPKIHFPG